MGEPVEELEPVDELVEYICAGIDPAELDDETLRHLCHGALVKAHPAEAVPGEPELRQFMMRGVKVTFGRDRQLSWQIAGQLVRDIRERPQRSSSPVLQPA
jgi:hypothetical protein